MKVLFLCFMLAISLSLDLIIINIIENSSFQFKFYISSLILTSITIFLIAVEAILWLFNFSEKVQTGIISINFMINISKSTYFSISYFINNSISSSVVILSFLTFVISIIIGLTNTTNHSSVEPINYSITFHKFDETEKNCSICLEDFIQSEIIHITPCKHLFHISCIKEIIKNNITTCPNCRLSIL